MRVPELVRRGPRGWWVWVLDGDPRVSRVWGPLCGGPDRGLGEDKTDNPRTPSGTRFRALVWPPLVYIPTTAQACHSEASSTHCRIGPAERSQAEKFLSLSIFSFNKIRKPGVAGHACHPRTGEPGATRSPELEPSPDYNTVSSRLVNYRVSGCIKE